MFVLMSSGRTCLKASSTRSVTASEVIANSAELPSARLLEEMQRQGSSFFELALRMSQMHRDYFQEMHPPNPGRLAELRTEAAHSLEEQARIEKADMLPFREFVARYFAGTLV